MTERLVELLLKGVRQLPQGEQDEVLGVFLGGLTPASDRASGSELAPAPGSSPVTLPSMDPWHVEIPALPAAVLGVRAAQPLGVLDGLGTTVPTTTVPTTTVPTTAVPTTAVPTTAETALKVLPVRLPVNDYERLRAFSREHGFSMAVIIRTLVERFLDERGGTEG